MCGLGTLFMFTEETSCFMFDYFFPYSHPFYVSHAKRTGYSHRVTFELSFGNLQGSCSYHKLSLSVAILCHQDMKLAGEMAPLVNCLLYKYEGLN